MPESARSTAIEVAEAFLTLHEAGLVYRALDWDKLHINEDEEIRFADLDQCISADFGVTHRRSEAFSNRYLAPEAAIGSYEEASDWWALGAMLLQCATRGSGIPDISDQAFMMQLVTRGLPIPENIPDQWQHLLKGLLTRDPAKRWRGGELLRWLEGGTRHPRFLRK